MGQAKEAMIKEEDRLRLVEHEKELEQMKEDDREEKEDKLKDLTPCLL